MTINHHQKLPPTWVWTRRNVQVEGGTLWFARDTRWPATVPDLASTSEADVIRQAFECDHTAERWQMKTSPCGFCLRYDPAAAKIENQIEAETED